MGNVISRMMRIFGAAGIFLVVTGTGGAKERPNILWITSEDNARFLGCYGDSAARTPNLDRLAEEGIRYANAFANAPVCAVARSSWIYGLPAVSLGTIHMRSRYAVPGETFTPYPSLLRQAGYYTTNNSKTDYNTRSIDPKVIWDESSGAAHYRNRPEGSPFFAIFNIHTSHESSIFPGKNRKNPQTKAEDIRLPPYQAPLPEVINDWRNYYDQIEMMDRQVGKIIDELKASGQADDTIVVYCSDHAGVTLRSKRYLYDSGTRVPLIMYFPERWRHLAPGKPGTVPDRLVQFIDMPKTWLALAGIDPPPQMSGHIFAGEGVEPEPETVFLFSGRFDEAPDTSRAVTDGRWKYIRNFEPDRPRFQMLHYPMRQDGQYHHWQAFREGKTNALQSAFYHEQASEELYDTLHDPHEIENLVEDRPEELKRLRSALRTQIIENRDLGFIPEPMMAEIDRRPDTTLYDFGQSEDNYPLEEILDLAIACSEGAAGNADRFRKALKEENPILRHWGAVGLRVLGGSKAQPARTELEDALKDDEVSVRIPAMVALARVAGGDRAIQLLIQEARDATGDIEAAWALDGLKLLDAPIAVREVPSDSLNKGEYSKRLVEILQAGGSAWKMPEKRL